MNPATRPNKPPVSQDEKAAHYSPSVSAVEFLQKLRADGPWVLTAIGPDSRVIVTHTFTTTECSAPVHS